jgi:hypothetical protein
MQMTSSGPTWKIIAWSVERPMTTHYAFSAAEAYVLALDKYVYASFQIKILNPGGVEITIDDLRSLSEAEAKQKRSPPVE